MGMYDRWTFSLLLIWSPNNAFKSVDQITWLHLTRPIVLKLYHCPIDTDVLNPFNTEDIQYPKFSRRNKQDGYFM